MAFFSVPSDQGRLNATVHELIRLRFHGPVYIGGNWDPYDTLDYLECRMGLELIPTLKPDGSLFRLSNKFVSFTDECVIVSMNYQDVAGS
jgi:hypothetical protein